MIEKMKRIMVIGCCGAGKSTFSRKLNSITKIELIHLDQFYWKPNWGETKSEEWEKIVQHLADKPYWIMDGNYGGTMDIRIKRADTIIYLDYPTWKCLSRVTARTIKNWGRRRFDMPSDCKERFDFRFFHYVATFNLTRRENLLKKLRLVADEKKVIVFKNDIQAYHFLENLKDENRDLSL